MKLFRNHEVKLAVWVLLLITVIAVGIGCCIDFRCAVYAGILCVLLAVLFLLFLRKRYQNMEALAQQIDRILHGDQGLKITDDREGELSILKSEIYKMTIRLREQADCLEEDKVYLADSIADIAHQLRTPLTSVRLLLPRIRYSEQPEERLGIFRELDGLLTRVDWLIGALLKISRLESGMVDFKKERISLAELVEKAAAPLLIPMELREQNLVLKIGEKTGYDGDFSWSCEALGNILKNCMEHTPPRGTITVTAQETPIFTRLDVEDTGPGFQEADLPHLFERFYKGANSDKNSVGIGLALSKMIIQRQGGLLTAENKQAGIGARFTIRFYKGTV